MDAPQFSLQPSPTLQNNGAPITAVDHTSDDSKPTVEVPPQSKFTTVINNKKKKKQKKPLTDVCDPPRPSSSSSSSCCTSSSRSVHKGGGFRVSSNPNPRRVLIASVRHKERDVEALALPLGMSIAAVVAQVLERKDEAGKKMSVDHLSTVTDHGSSSTFYLLTCSGSSWCCSIWTSMKHLADQVVKAPSMICTLAVRESLANVFGDKFDCFVRNFEKSFRSTLMTLRLINENNGGEHLKHLNNESSDPTPSMSLNREGDSTCNSGVQDCHSEAILQTISSPEPLSILEENMPTNLTNRELALHDGLVCQQLASVSPNTLHSVSNQSMISALQNSVVEQARSNDLKILEIGLTMRKLQQKETQLALNSDSNILERCKLSLGISRASFKSEKFKNQLEDARHAELLTKCIDCLVAGLLIMLACLAYGTYVYSNRRIIEATAACTPTKVSKSWWISNAMASVKSGLLILLCLVQVASRMIFGGLMILAITYLLLQRSATSKQTMPVTFILLLLGVACGFAGKFCVDALGGIGYQWLLYWEALCLLHLFSNICTSALFIILHGPIVVSEGSKKGRTIFPYWIRRFLFFATVLVFLPSLCGFMPFASLGEWKDHFASLVIDPLPTRVD